MDKSSLREKGRVLHGLHLSKRENRLKYILSTEQLEQTETQGIIR
jgi:hypothetical protein